LITTVDPDPECPQCRVMPRHRASIRIISDP
jgi:hypothetical protein